MDPTLRNLYICTKEETWFGADMEFNFHGIPTKRSISIVEIIFDSFDTYIRVARLPCRKGKTVLIYLLTKVALMYFMAASNPRISLCSSILFPATAVRVSTMALVCARFIVFPSIPTV